MRSILAVIVTLALVASAVRGCPLVEDIVPCLCSEDTLGRLYLECRALDSQEQLAAIFQQDFPEKNYYNLFIDDSPFLTGLDDIFNGVSFEVVEIYRSGVEVITDYAFTDSLQSLQRLVLKNTLVDENTFPFLVMASYTNLTVLDIYSSELAAVPAFTSDSLLVASFRDAQITGVEADNFQGLGMVSNINLEQNDITAVQPGTFSNLPSLRSINLSENKLTTLEVGTFQLADATVSIYVWNNELADIQPGAFVLPPTNESLTIFLDLGSNQLPNLDEAVFADIFPYMDFLFIAGNPLECGCDMAWLVLNQSWMGKIGNTALCLDGRRLADLDPAEYEANC